MHGAVSVHATPNTESVPLKPRKQDKAVLLCIVEAHVKRANCVGELLECSAVLGEEVGA